MKRWLLAVVVMVLASCGGSGGAKLEAPEKAFERQLRYLADGQAGLAYEEIHPAQQALFSKDIYMRCVKEGGSFDVGSVKIVKVYDEEAAIPGTQVRAMAKAVTATVELKNGILKNSTTDTYHEVLVDGVWRFTVSDAAAYTATTCP